MDLIASVFQVIMVMFLCFSNNRNNKIGIYSVVSVILSKNIYKSITTHLYSGIYCYFNSNQ